MKRIVVGSWFSLPRLGRDVFATLMKQGVAYDKEMGFKFDAATDLPSAVRTLSAATGEEIELTLRCFVCGREACPGCPYLPVCDRTTVSSYCLCADHASELQAYEKSFRDVALSA